jgi:hypothetical protein
MRYHNFVLFYLTFSSLNFSAFAQMPPPDGEEFPPPFGTGGPPGRFGGQNGMPPRMLPPGQRNHMPGMNQGPARQRVQPSKAALQQPNEQVLSALSSSQKLATFSGNVRASLSMRTLEVHSNGIPNHQTANYPNEHNPNSILEQDYHFHIPLKPQIAEKITPLPFGPIGVAANGIPFYNPYNAEGRDAVFGPNAEVFDSCCGHPDPRGRYHYHQYPICLNSPFRDPLGKHSPLIGWAFDGFAIYGPNGEDGQSAKDLDECNGHIDKVRGYHYHVTKKFPYVLGAYRGVVNMENFDGPVWGH